ncbi:MAG: DNA primase [Desulfurococcaceae archaeon]|nr:DNA primase [Desulfurococcaceae archaeon]
MAKYLIRARIVVAGVVEKHDIIGALFGQTEGLLGSEFDLRILQDKGRVGRIIVNTKTQGNKTIGEILIPSNLDRIETALLAAMIETVDRVGPYDAEVKVQDIQDLRLEKIKMIVERTVEILRVWGKEKTPDLKEVIKTIQEYLKAPEPVSYGPEGLPAGPDVEKNDVVIVVEGRADVINLLRYGYTNVIALGGARRVPETIKNLASRKKIILLVDGDHGGDLIIKEVLRTIKVDYVARAPPDREVEDLAGKEVEEALNNAKPVFEYLEEALKTGEKDVQELIQVQKKLHKIPVEVREAETIQIPSSVLTTAKGLQGTLESILYSQDWSEVKKIPVRDLVNELESIEPGRVYAVLMDGIVTQRLIDTALSKNVKLLIAARIGKIQVKPPELTILTYNELFT